MDTLSKWAELMDINDLQCFHKYQRTSKADLEQMREEWKAMRRFALGKLNEELNKSGKEGQLLNIDVSDDQLYPYLDDYHKKMFFTYSRILDFSDGYIPKGLKLITKGLPLQK